MVIKYDFRHRPLDGDLLVTTACPVGCAFCVYACEEDAPPQKWMPEPTIHKVAQEYIENDFNIRICGGEPFYNLTRLERCMDILLEYYDPFQLLIITSAVFAKNMEATQKNIEALHRRSFDTLVVSFDRFHLPRVPLQYIVNTLDVCQEIGIEVLLRMSFDSLSYPAIDMIAPVIVKYRTPIEVHSWGNYGKGEKLGDETLKDFNIVEQYLFTKMKEAAEKDGAPWDPRYYISHSPKRSQRNFYPNFFPTIFPNGDVHGCSITCKMSLMGNINTQSLQEMMASWKKTLPGFYMISNTSCHYLRNLLPPKYNQDRCEFCRDQPFDAKPMPDTSGRVYMKIEMEDDFDALVEEAVKEGREMLLSFRLTEKDLWNQESAAKINSFLNNLKAKRVMFKLSRPLPPCLGIDAGKEEPKNCFECREMFTVENGQIRYCEPMGRIKGLNLEHVRNRDQIYEYFELERKGKKIPEICQKCIYNIRGQCNSLCLIS